MLRWIFPLAFVVLAVPAFAATYYSTHYSCKDLSGNVEINYDETKVPRASMRIFSVQSDLTYAEINFDSGSSASIPRINTRSRRTGANYEILFERPKSIVPGETVELLGVLLLPPFFPALRYNIDGPRGPYGPVVPQPLQSIFPTGVGAPFAILKCQARFGSLDYEGSCGGNL